MENEVANDEKINGHGDLMEQRAEYDGMILINALNLHRNTVQSLWQLSKLQNDFLKQKNFTKLFSIREEKENLLCNLKKRSHEIRFYYENWFEWKHKLSKRERNRLVSITDNISVLIERMLSLEMENRLLLEKRKDELAQELGTVNFYQDCLFSVFENRN